MEQNTTPKKSITSSIENTDSPKKTPTPNMTESMRDTSTILKILFELQNLPHGQQFMPGILEKFVYDWYQTCQESGELKNKLAEEQKKIGEEIPINASFFFAKIHGAMDDIMGAFETNKFQSIRIREFTMICKISKSMSP
jgi:hypothetical protein